MSDNLGKAGMAAARDPDAPKEALSLDQIAALLVQLEPDDAAGLSELREILSTTLEHSSQPARPALSAAIELIDSSAADPSGDPDILTKLGALIEQAISLDENEQEGALRDASEGQSEGAADIRELFSFEELPADIDASLVSEFFADCRENIE